MNYDFNYVDTPVDKFVNNARLSESYRRSFKQRTKKQKQAVYEREDLVKRHIKETGNKNVRLMSAQLEINMHTLSRTLRKLGYSIIGGHIVEKNR